MRLAFSLVGVVVLYLAAFFSQNYIIQHTNKKYKYVVPTLFLIIMLVLLLTKIITFSTFIIFSVIGALQLFGLEQQLKRNKQNKALAKKKEHNEKLDLK